MVAHAFAQSSEECGCGLEMLENMNYSAGGLLEVFPRHFTHDQANALQHNPRSIAARTPGPIGIIAAVPCSARSEPPPSALPDQPRP